MRSAINDKPVSISFFCRQKPRESADFWAQQPEHLFATRAAACRFTLAWYTRTMTLSFSVISMALSSSVKGWAERLSLECSIST